MSSEIPYRSAAAESWSKLVLKAEILTLARVIKKIITLLECPQLALWALMRLRVRRVRRPDALFYSYKGALYPAHLTGGDAKRWIEEKALSYCKGYGLDIGAGRWPLPGAIGIDKTRTIDAYHLDPFEDGSLDFIFSSHSLEHLQWWKKALALWARKLKVGGVLFLYLPHPEMKLWHPRSPWVGSGHKWIPTLLKVKSCLQAIGMRVVEASETPDNYWSFYVISVKTADRSNSG